MNKRKMLQKSFFSSRERLLEKKDDSWQRTKENRNKTQLIRFTVSTKNDQSWQWTKQIRNKTLFILFIETAVSEITTNADNEQKKTTRKLDWFCSRFQKKGRKLTMNKRNTHPNSIYFLRGDSGCRKKTRKKNWLRTKEYRNKTPFILFNEKAVFRKKTTKTDHNLKKTTTTLDWFCSLFHKKTQKLTMNKRKLLQNSIYFVHRDCGFKKN